MSITLLKNITLSAICTMLVSSCGTSTSNTPTAGTSASGVSQSSLKKQAGDAAVDAATKNSDPLTAAAIRNQTGYGTDPVEKAKADTIRKLGF